MTTKSRDFVGEYDNIRQILRDQFLYGCYSVADFKNKGISTNKFNQEKRKLLEFLRPNFQRINGKSAMYFRNDMFDSAHNFLLDTFAMKSAVNSEIELFVLIMQMLTENNDEMTKNELLNKFYFMAYEIDATTLYRQLCKMTDNGYIGVNKSKIPYIYKLCDTIFAGIDNDELLSLLNGVDLLKNVIYPSASGNLLFELLNEYRKSIGLIEIYNSPFLLKHSHFGQVLDDEVLWELMQAISHSSAIRFVYNKNEISAIYPIKLIVDEGYGRRYLFGVLPQNDDKPCLYRLDKISKLKIKKDMHFEIDKYTDLYEKQTKYSFTGASLLYDKQPLTVELSFTTKIAPYVKRRFPGASFSQDEKAETVKFLVNDTTELKPWLRRFTGEIDVLPSKEHNLANEMEAEFAEWRALYEAVQ